MSDEQLRALTVKQPLAWAIIHGHKDVENRSWKFPGEIGDTIAVHAGKKVVPLDELPVQIDVPEDFPRGAIVGVVDVVDDHDAGDCDPDDTGRRCSPWAYPGVRHWVLSNPRIIDEAIPTRGYLWLFVPPPEVTAALNAALRGEH